MVLLIKSAGRKSPYNKAFKSDLRGSALSVSIGLVIAVQCLSKVLALLTT